MDTPSSMVVRGMRPATSQLSGLADMVVAMARQFAPDSCDSAAGCFRLTRDVRESVQLMMAYLRRPDLLDEGWVAPWRQAA